MAESSIIIQPYKPDGSPSRTKLKAQSFPETIYDSNTSTSAKKNVPPVGIFDKNPTKVLKSFASNIWSNWSPLRATIMGQTKSDTEETKNSFSGLIGRGMKKSDSATAMEIFEKHMEDTKILKEYELLIDHCPPGVYTIPSLRSVQVWHGIIFVRSGIYERGGFRFDLFIPDGFPLQWPLVRFRSFIFHPQISMINGSLNVPDKFHTWIPDQSHIWELLLYIYYTFDEIELDNAVNEKAAAMYRDDIERFKRRTRDCVEQSIDEMKYSSDSVDVEVYGDEANLLCYEEYSEERVKELKSLMMAEELPEFEDKPSGGVLSWLGESLSRPLSTVFSI